jgi:rSAM/selenodomain-associated transferase 1
MLFNKSILHRTALIVFAKVPGSSAKTRIAATEGPEMARRIYGKLLRKTAESLSSLPYHVAYANANDPGELGGIFDDAISFFQQGPGDLGERLLAACSRFFIKGYDRFCIIGSDCPGLAEQDIVDAATALENGADVVLGPAEDGGYYLVCIEVKGLAVFQAKQWGSAGLLEETLRIAKSNHLKTSLLAPKFDIDTIGDYKRWRPQAE